MKLNETKLLHVTSHRYSCYLLTPTSRDYLLSIFVPTYPRAFAHHITVNYGIPRDSSIPAVAKTAVVGRVSKDGIDALIVTVNGTMHRSANKYYHITWSLDNNHRPVDSNRAIVQYFSDQKILGCLNQYILKQLPLF